MEYRVLIPTAGIGSRLNKYSKNINKALVSISHKPAISYIIEKFDKEMEFVIPLGYKGNIVRSFLELTYPDRKFIFVEIDDYNIGLGYTILKCEEYLQMPFIFISNDTIVLEDIPKPSNNWMGYSIPTDSSQYRSIIINDNKVLDICAKGASGDVKPYIGVCGVYNYTKFWNSMKIGIPNGSYDIGESYGLRYLLYDNIQAINFTWFDTGNIESLNKTKEYFKNKSLIDANILEKEDEAIWFIDNKVVKFSTDLEFIKNRVSRAIDIKGYVPKILGYSDNIYVYEKVDGDVLSKMPHTFNSFLEYMIPFWKINLNVVKEEFNNICMSFYKDKTYKRVHQYLTSFEHIDSVDVINGNEVPKVIDILDSLDWDYISNGIPVRYHGDLHFENILVTNDSFKLLDWRQDFGGIIDFGDIYYDFAKLNHGLIISHEIVDRNLYSVDKNGNNIKYEFMRKNSIVECEKIFKNWIIRNGYDYKKVQILTALIYLNIAALHHYPYSTLLFYLGKNMLYQVK